MRTAPVTPVSMRWAAQSQRTMSDEHDLVAFLACNTPAQASAGPEAVLWPPRHWGFRTLAKGRYALEEFVPVRVDCALPEGASFEYAAASLMAGVNPIIGVTEVC